MCIYSGERIWLAELNQSEYVQVEEQVAGFWASCREVMVGTRTCSRPHAKSFKRRRLKIYPCRSPLGF